MCQEASGMPTSLISNRTSFGQTQHSETVMKENTLYDQNKQLLRLKRLKPIRVVILRRPFASSLAFIDKMSVLCVTVRDLQLPALVLSGRSINGSCTRAPYNTNTQREGKGNEWERHRERERNVCKCICAPN